MATPFYPEYQQLKEIYSYYHNSSIEPYFVVDAIDVANYEFNISNFLQELIYSAEDSNFSKFLDKFIIKVMDLYISADRDVDFFEHVQNQYKLYKLTQGNTNGS